MVSEYNNDQLNALKMVKTFLKSISSSERSEIKKKMKPYLEFRSKVLSFHNKNLSDICTAKCFLSGESACCNSEGIATFFSDFVVNIFSSDPDSLKYMEKRLLEKGNNKCVYLTEEGCLWYHKPIICEMFLCEHAKVNMGVKGESVLKEWNQLKEEEKNFTWPDKPVLFDELEALFIEKGFDSPLMYFHKSPGLLKVKSEAGIREKK
jgi:hypothetical protein